MVKGVFQLYDCIGIPLEDVFLMIKKENMIVDMIDFYEDAIKKKWPLKTIISKLQIALEESNGKECAIESLKRLNFYINSKK